MAGQSGVVEEGEVVAGKYRVERVLGVGGMGVVVAARHLQLDERVALKILTPAALASAEVVARFEREARAAVKIKSEHVARVIDVGALDGGAPYIVMEYLDGEDLASFLATRGALAVDVAVDFVLQACVALAEAHALGIVHRDLKPANLFCVRRSDGRLCIKVIDFGISKMASSDDSRSSFTRTSSVVGTPMYMSPEQIKTPRDVGPRADIWALGAILYELVTSKPAFDGETMLSLGHKITSEPFAPLASHGPGAPARLEPVIARCLAKDPADRFPDVGALAAALVPFGAEGARGLAERVAAIVQGVRATSDLGSPASVGRAPTVAADGPVTAVTAALPSRAPTTASLWLVPGVLAIAAVAAIAGLVLRSPGHRSSDAAQPAAPALASSPVATPTSAPLEAPDASPLANVAPPATGVPPPAPGPPEKKRPRPAAGASPLRSPTPTPSTHSPCKLVTTLDANGEPHFSCPCASCQ